MNLIFKVALFPIIFLVSNTDCRYWEVGQTRLDPTMDAVVGTSEEARTVLSCSRYCEKPPQRSLTFYFSEENHMCHCSNKYDFRAEDPSSDPIIYGFVVPRTDCMEYYQNGYQTDGRYILEPTTGLRTIAWCDMENGGWTVIQRRLDGSVDFYRNWTEYAGGFGDTAGEYWIGLDNIHYLTQEPSELYIYLETFGDVTPTDGYAWYSYFSVANSSLLYQLSIAGRDYRGNIADSMSSLSNGNYFTTYDRDNDSVDDNCAITYRGAWWYRDCHSSNLNGVYLTGVYSSFADGVNWFDPWGFHYSLKTVTMKIRRL